jgi:DNA polymerase III epsilon subunit-like protein
MRIAIIDWETTGLTLHPDAPAHKQPRAIEFGGIVLDRAETILEASILINPGIPLEPIITKITGLTDEDLREAPPFEVVLPQLREFFAGVDGVVAHNLPFDRAILRNELARLNVLDFPWPRRELCTIGVYSPDWGRNPKLIELYPAVMGRPLAQTHRALDDVKALAEIFIKDQLWELME